MKQARPCGRCLKRGLESTCQDGLRKKAKYLREIDSERNIPRSRTSLTSSRTTNQAGRTSCLADATVAHASRYACSRGNYQFSYVIATSV